MAASGTLHAQARGSPRRETQSGGEKAKKGEEVLDDAARARRTYEMETWLRRLVGRFRIEGTVGTSKLDNTVFGIAECVGVGDGSGVRCKMFARWNSFRSTEHRFTNFVKPVEMLYGFDPDTLELQELWATDHIEERTGVLKDDAVTFPKDPWGGFGGVCTASGFSACGGGHQVIAKPEGEIIIKIRLGSSLADMGEMRLIREQPADAEGESPGSLSDLTK